MTKLSEFDIDELVLQLHEELKYAFHLAQVEQLGDRFRIDTLKAKMGRKNLRVTDSNKEINLLNSDKYPDEEDWEIEVNYSRKQDPSGIETFSAGFNDRSLLDNLKDLPLSSLKGINVYWQEIYSKGNINNFGDLATMPHEAVLTLCKNKNTFLPLEFQTKVLLLNQRITRFKHPDFSKTSFGDISLKSDSDLKLLFSSRLTAIEISQIRNVSNLLMMIIDKDVFLNLTLEILIFAY